MDDDAQLPLADPLRHTQHIREATPRVATPHVSRSTPTYQSGPWPGRRRIETRPATSPARFSQRLLEKPSWRSRWPSRSEEHTSELQSRGHLVCRLLLEKKN